MTDLQTVALAFRGDADIIIEHAIKESSLKAISELTGITKERLGKMKAFEIKNRLSIIMAKDFLKACDEEEER